METVWFVIVVLMMGVYVVLDGFDIGVGIVYLWVAKSAEERQAALTSIGPVWDGNEVWLIAAGGVLFMAFPDVYASAFSGFYLALFILLWLLIGRGLALELRHHVDDPLWRSFWDGVFSLCSLLLALVLGAALGNVLRGVPLDANGDFFTPLWTNFLTGPQPGILDWYTVLVGLLAVMVLAVHGTNYLALRTAGMMQQRAHQISGLACKALLPLSLFSVIVTPLVQPLLADRLNTHPAGYLLLLLAALALGGLFYFGKNGRNLAAFASSKLLILGLLGTAAFALYPNLLISSANPAGNLTIFNSAASLYGLRVALVWWLIGLILVCIYMAFVYRSFWGTVEVTAGEGY
ncbi:MAG: cytochrome d ubiquinol oxidase subunit II [Anaerolineales bacterium]|nr:cytochrome d ubiquinol oxidase subunit II [Anaerolineales bacterium]